MRNYQGRPFLIPPLKYLYQTYFSRSDDIYAYFNNYVIVLKANI